MKHFIISCVIFIIIIGGSILSHNYIENTLKDLRLEARTLTEVTSISSENIMHITDIKEKYESKKNMLQLFLNKEHIQEIESNILLLEDAYKNENADNLREKSILLICLLEHADSSLTSFS